MLPPCRSLGSAMMTDRLQLVPVHARELVQAILDGDVHFDYIDVLSDQTVRIGRYPEGYQLPEAVTTSAVEDSEPEQDLFVRWRDRFR